MFKTLNILHVFIYLKALFVVQMQTYIYVKIISPVVLG
jgi:hypothetical protein